MILDTIAPVIPHLRHVAIDEAPLRQVCARVAPKQLRLPTWDDDVFILHPPESRAAQILLFNTINFSYWGDPKWTIDFHGRPLDGAWGMLGALARAREEGFPIFGGRYLAEISAAGMRHILRGNVEIPMFEARLDIWREVGRGLLEHFDGDFIRLIKAAGNDALALVDLLVTHFPSFDDTAALDEHTIVFYKRAQLATAMLYEAFGGTGLGNLVRAERLTVFADYKLPQVLRRLGILRYHPHLAAHIDRREPLAAGSREEIEIRAATIWAAELMRQDLASRAPEITALHIDYWLWQEGQAKGPTIKPYHRTRTIDY
ncbi:MAG TPA: hypothetical protein ENN19_01425 [Chloroflexi bacterium]|nr:hypothetical protein [Chloroflexota bacterium]